MKTQLLQAIYSISFQNTHSVKSIEKFFDRL